jgi:hypothetical protein
MDELERLEQLKKEAKEKPLKTVKKKPCASCKKKAKEVKQVVLPAPEPEYVWTPTRDEIKLALAELTNMKGVRADKREFINNVYKFLFNEEFDFDCGGCASRQALRMHNFCLYMLKIEI